MPSLAEILRGLAGGQAGPNYNQNGGGYQGPAYGGPTSVGSLTAADPIGVQPAAGGPGPRKPGSPVPWQGGYHPGWGEDNMAGHPGFGAPRGSYAPTDNPRNLQTAEGSVGPRDANGNQAYAQAAGGKAGVAPIPAPPAPPPGNTPNPHAGAGRTAQGFQPGSAAQRQWNRQNPTPPPAPPTPAPGAPPPAPAPPRPGQLPRTGQGFQAGSAGAQRYANMSRNLAALQARLAQAQPAQRQQIQQAITRIQGELQGMSRPGMAPPPPGPPAPPPPAPAPVPDPTQPPPPVAGMSPEMMAQLVAWLRANGGMAGGGMGGIG